ncbi:MAG: ParB/RepB/Spo0J family partition protein [Candidatus Magasanikbacteria bacterium]|nr:ParB/RepB/Spo0J family partition protein [Candidatus Magasanikbacteria bacterium]
MALGKGLGSLIPTFKTNTGTPAASVGGSSFSNSSVSSKTGLETPKMPEGIKEGRLWHIPISLIRANSYQPRRIFEHQDLEDLINSIKEHGILQPLLVTEREDGTYELVAGERRLRSAMIAGLSTVPAVIKNIKGSQKLELALIENIQRKNLNPIEEAFAYERLMEEFKLTQEEVGKRVGKSRPYIGNILRLLDLPTEIQRGLVNGEISSTAARAILGLKNEKEQIKFYNKLLEEGGSVHDVESSISETKLKSGVNLRRDPLILDWEKKLREKLGTKVQITKTGAKGKIVIDYYSDEELRRLMGEMTK